MFLPYALFAPANDAGAGDPDGEHEGLQEEDLEEGSDGEQPSDEGAAGEEDDPEEGRDEEEGVDAEPPRRASRATDAVRQAKARAREASERATRLERYVADLRRSVAQPQQRQETPEERAARHALMDPMAVMQEQVNEAVRRADDARAQMTREANDAADRASFTAVAAEHPIVAKIASEVEQKYQEARAQGQNPPKREVIARYLIGDRILKGKGSVDAQRKAADARLGKQKVSPGNARGDTAGERRRSGKTPAERLENVPI